MKKVGKGEGRKAWTWVLGKKLSPKNGIIFIFQYTYDQAKVMAAAFTRLIQTVARQKTRSRPFATWKLSVEVGL